MIPVEQVDPKVEAHVHPLARVSPHEVSAQGLVVPGEAECPAVVAVAENKSSEEKVFLLACLLSFSNSVFN